MPPVPPMAPQRHRIIRFREVPQLLPNDKSQGRENKNEGQQKQNPFPAEKAGEKIRRKVSHLWPIGLHG